MSHGNLHQYQWRGINSDIYIDIYWRCENISNLDSNSKIFNVWLELDDSQKTLSVQTKAQFWQDLTSFCVIWQACDEPNLPGKLLPGSLTVPRKNGAWENTTISHKELCCCEVCCWLALYSSRWQHWRISYWTGQSTLWPFPVYSWLRGETIVA